MCAILTIEYYQPFFDVDTEDVKDRLKLALIPFKDTFFQISKDSPDLYGPFWILTTLIVMIAANGNIHALI